MNRSGVGWIVAGVILLGLGIIATVAQTGYVWYGAMIVGVIWIVRGLMRLKNEAPPPQS